MNEQLAGLRPAQRDALRLVGAVLFATGAFVLFFRKEAQEQWAAFPKLLVLAIPCVLLYGLGIGALRIGRPDDDDRPADAPRWVSPWRATALVIGLILLPFVLAQLVETLGGDSDNSWHTTWIFLAVAAAAGYAALVHGLRWGALFGGISLIIAWMAFWDAAADPSVTTIRWLLIVIGAFLVVAALRAGAEREHEHEAPELITAAGIAGIAAGLTGLLSGLGSLIGGAISSAFGGDGDLEGASQGQEWNVFLLVVTLALLWYGARAAWRGPVYVGALGLLAFIVSVGSEITQVFDGDRPTGDLVGWPLLLLLLGGAALLAGLFGGGDDRAEAPTTVAAPGPPPPAT